MYIETITLDPSHIELVRFHASKCSIGGTSHIRSKDERQEFLGEDQFIGQAGTLALHLLLLKDMGVEIYDNERKLRNETPLEGDGGSDLPGYRIDVKSSKRRRANKPLADYNLYVAKREMHPDTCYVQCTIDTNEELTKAICHLTGWSDSSDFPDNVETDGIFRGSYVIPVRATRDIRALPSVLMSYRQLSTVG